MSDVPFYRKHYARRRNRYCKDHISEQKPSYCEHCRAIQTSSPVLSVYEIGNDTKRGEMLDFAAYLEYQIATRELSLNDARYQFVERYPESNCLPSNNKNDVSVLSMIIPFYDTEHSIPEYSPIRKQ